MNESDEYSEKKRECEWWGHTINLHVFDYLEPEAMGVGDHEDMELIER